MSDLNSSLSLKTWLKTIETQRCVGTQRSSGASGAMYNKVPQAPSANAAASYHSNLHLGPHTAKGIGMLQGTQNAGKKTQDGRLENQPMDDFGVDEISEKKQGLLIWFKEFRKAKVNNFD